MIVITNKSDNKIVEMSSLEANLSIYNPANHDKYMSGPDNAAIGDVYNGTTLTPDQARIDALAAAKATFDGLMAKIADESITHAELVSLLKLMWINN